MLRHAIDVLIPLAPGDRATVMTLHSLTRQSKVDLRVYEVHGPPPRPTVSRVETIAQTRNIAKTRGTQPLVFFLDSDVVLPPDCLYPLAESLYDRRSDYAAISIPYQMGALDGDANEDVYHTAMGAVLWRRSCLEKLVFRSEPGSTVCECRLAIEDVFTQQSLAVGVSTDTWAVHLRDLVAPDLYRLNGAHEERIQRVEAFADRGNARLKEWGYE